MDDPGCATVQRVGVRAFPARVDALAALLELMDDTVEVFFERDQRLFRIDVTRQVVAVFLEET